jgi:hypothetical protein
MCLLNLDQNALLCPEAGHRLNEALPQRRFPRAVSRENRESHLQGVEERGLVTPALMGLEGKRTLRGPDGVGGLGGLRGRLLPLRHGSNCTGGVRTLIDTHGPFQHGVTPVTRAVKKRLGAS